LNYARKNCEFNVPKTEAGAKAFFKIIDGHLKPLARAMALRRFSGTGGGGVPPARGPAGFRARLMPAGL